MFQSITSHRVTRLLVATIASLALVGLSVGQVFAGYTHP